MKYITIADMNRTIRENFHRVPHDVDFVIGVPRSGMIAASIISELLNIPLIDLDSFVFGASPTGGNRLRFHRESKRERKRALVVDDTIFNGGSNRLARQKLQPFTDRFDFIYMVIYQEGKCTNADLALEDLRSYTDNGKDIVLYEWNILHHDLRVMSTFLFDMDGVLCVDPPDERKGQEYIEYIKNATPLFIPTSMIGEIVTYRLESNRTLTENWLKEHKVWYEKLTMAPFDNWYDRHMYAKPAIFKSDIYNDREWAKLFVESDDKQAQTIHTMTGKPVYCVTTNKMYE